MKQILYADAGNRLLAIVKIYIASRLGTGHYLWPGPFECYLTEVIPTNNI